jgi:hypothetical protein
MNKKLIIVIFIVLLVLGLFAYKQIYYYNSYINLHSKNFKNYYKNKKVAILISGQIRDGYYECLMSQKACIIDLYDTDVFCSFSDDVSDKIKKHVTKILNPKHIEWIKSDNKYNINDKYYHNTYLMFKKIYLCNKYKKDYEKKNNFKYDMVIRIRPDLLISSSIPKMNLSNKTIYLPQLSAFVYKYILNIFAPYTDQIAIGNSMSIDIYSNIYKYFLNILKKHKKITPETILHNFLKNKKLSIHRILYKHIIYKYCINVSNKNNEKFKVLYILPSYIDNKFKILFNNL